MNRTVTITPKNHKYANTYGGNICASDFCTDYEGTRNIANRIIADWKFDMRNKKEMKKNWNKFRGLADDKM